MDKLQLIAFVLMLTWGCWEILKSAVNDGKPRKQRVFRTITATLLSIVLLYFGGFYNQVGIPQIIWFVLTAIGAMAVSAGYIKDGRYSFGASLFAHVVLWVIYITGGFWYKGFIPFH